LEVDKLFFWKGVEKGLQQHDGLTEASVQIIVSRIEKFPVLIGVNGVAFGELIYSRIKALGEILDHSGQGRNFVEELGLPRQEDLAEETVEKRRALTLGILKISGIERYEVRCGAKVAGVLVHGSE